MPVCQEVKFGTDKKQLLGQAVANRDIALMVNLCSKEDYGIKVYYWKGPLPLPVR